MFGLCSWEKTADVSPPASLVSATLSRAYKWISPHCSPDPYNLWRFLLINWMRLGPETSNMQHARTFWWTGGTGPMFPEKQLAMVASPEIEAFFLWESKWSSEPHKLNSGCVNLKVEKYIKVPDNKRVLTPPKKTKVPHAKFEKEKKKQAQVSPS